MNITVTMTAEEFEDFRVHQRDKTAAENRARRDVNEIRATCNDGFSALLRAFEENPNAADGEPCGDIVDWDALCEAVCVANEWFG